MHHTARTEKDRLIALAAVLACAVLVFAPLTGSAQALTGTNDPQLIVTPQLPKPYDPVRIELSSFSIDLNRSQISWYEDGKLSLSGIDERVFETRAGKAGSVTRIEVRIKPATGAQISRSMTVRPAGVDILWYAHAYTPPFYRGKALPPSRGFIVFTALPELVSGSGAVSDPKNVIYTWKQTGITLGNASGYGRQQIVLEGEAVSQQPMNVSVITTSFGGTLEAADSTQLRVNAPLILFYEKHPLEGIRYEKALDRSFVLQKDEVTLRAEPYFFSLDDIVNDLLSYAWKVGGTDVEQTAEKANEISLRREGARSGTIAVSLEVRNENLDKVLQEARALLRMELE